MIEKTEEQKGKSRLKWVGIVSILILGLFFRFYNIDKKVYWVDEVSTSLWISGYTPTEVKNYLSDRIVNIEELKKFQFANSEKDVFHTINNISKEDTHHAPLYYCLVRSWVRWFGESIWIVRSFSVMASLFTFPLLFWLCRELFDSKWVAWMAVMILAVSPVNVLLSQEAREYSIWTSTILLSSATLVRASRLNSKLLWILYASTIVLGIYAHTLFILVVVSHGVYIFGFYLNKIRINPLRIPGQLLFFLAATLAGLLAFTPWAYLIFTNLSLVKSRLSWVNNEVGPLYLIGQWGFNFSSVFVDPGYTFKYVRGFDPQVLFSYSVRVIILILITYSIYFLYRNTTKRIRLFLISLIFIPFLLLAVPDLVLGGTRSGNGYRFLMPSYLGVLTAVAYLLTTKIIYSSIMRRLWEGLTGLVLLIGIISCIISSQAEVWWTKPNDYFIPGQARIINNTPHPPLIIESRNLIRILSFSHRLNPHAQLLVIENAEKLRIPHGYSDVFVYNPSDLLKVNQDHADGLKLEQVDNNGLWLLKK